MVITHQSDISHFIIATILKIKNKVTKVVKGFTSLKAARLTKNMRRAYIRQPSNDLDCRPDKEAYPSQHRDNHSQSKMFDCNVERKG